MNVIEVKQKVTKKRMFFYVLIVLVCVMAIGIAIYQFFADEKLGVILGITSTQDEEKYNELKSEFDNIFTNSLLQSEEQENTNKLEQDEDLVYTEYEKEENSTNDYDVKVSIPYINIDSNVIEKYNEEIKNTFETKAESALQTKNKNIIYSVEYSAEITDEILSVIIRSTLKEGSSAQRVIIKTYNYDLKNNKEISLEEMLELRNIDIEEAQEKINSEIKQEQTQAEELQGLGYNIYTRDSTNDIYVIENTTEFFVHNNYLYVIYPYGNQENTSEVDLVIF